MLWKQMQNKKCVKKMQLTYRNQLHKHHFLCYAGMPCTFKYSPYNHLEKKIYIDQTERSKMLSRERHLYFWTEDRFILIINLMFVHSIKIITEAGSGSICLPPHTIKPQLLHPGKYLLKQK